VSNAADALRHLASDPVDVLFTDINLPGGMDGAALARRARELMPHLPVVYASARISMLEPDARVPGAIIVPKPYEPALVGRLLTAALKSAAAAVPA
jgi:CheY-like chemotaxis protein